MGAYVRSLLTALLLSGALVALGVEGVAPHLPPYVGTPDVVEMRTLSLPAAPRLEIHAADGSVRVAADDDAASSRCKIVADIRLYRADFGETSINPADYAALVVAAEIRDEVIHLRSLPEDWPAEIASIVNYNITVPRGTDVELRGANGNVWVDEGCGKVSIESGNADVQIADPTGPVTARSTNGRLRLTGGQGPAVLETVNGNIRAEMSAGSLTASSVNGRVRAEVVGPRVLACALRSENGDVEVGLGAEVGFTLDATARRGSVTGDTGPPVDYAAPGVFRSIEGTGDTLLTLSTSNGSIRLIRR